MSKVKKVVSDPADNWIIPLGVGGGMLIAVGAFLAYIVAKDETGQTSILMFILGNVMILSSLIIVFMYVKSAPEVMVNENEVVLRRLFWVHKIPRSKIKNVHVEQKSLFRFLFNWSYTESTIIELKNGNEIVLYDFLYEGFGRTKKALKFLLIDSWPATQPKPTIQPIGKHEGLGDNFISVKGRPIGFNLIMLVGFNMLFLYDYIVENDNVDLAGILIHLVGNIFFIWLFGSRSFFLVFDERIIQIRNRYWFWIKKSYRVGDIEKVVYQDLIHREPPSILFKLKNGKITSRFPMETFKNKDWEFFFSKLEQLGIIYRK
ncbi:hypothetical protein [Ekhidna sp.]